MSANIGYLLYYYNGLSINSEKGETSRTALKIKKKPLKLPKKIQPPMPMTWLHYITIWGLTIITIIRMNWHYNVFSGQKKYLFPCTRAVLPMQILTKAWARCA